MSEINQEQKSSIKLIKNSKGYGWEIKVYMEDKDLEGKYALNRLKHMDSELKKEFGDKK